MVIKVDTSSFIYGMIAMVFVEFAIIVILGLIVSKDD
jgi:hypothetical protein